MGDLEVLVLHGFDHNYHRNRNNKYVALQSQKSGRLLLLITSQWDG